MIYYILPSPLVKMPGNGVPDEGYIAKVIGNASADKTHPLQVEGRGHEGSVCITESEIPEIVEYTQRKLRESANRTRHSLRSAATIKEALGQVLCALPLYRARARRALEEHSET